MYHLISNQNQTDKKNKNLNIRQSDELPKWQRLTRVPSVNMVGEGFLLLYSGLFIESIILVFN